ncbi:MAG: hypothetical protein AB1509_14240 [Chloroflexota bacterium]|jgi:hypothetical protein
MFVVFPAVIIIIASALLGSILFFFGIGLAWHVWHFAKKTSQTNPKEEGRARSRSRDKSTR